MWFRACLRFAARKIQEDVPTPSEKCWRSYTRAVSSDAADDFIQQVTVANPSLKFRSVPQGSPVKYLYRVDRKESLSFGSGITHGKSDDANQLVQSGICREEWIPLCMKTVKRFKADRNAEGPPWRYNFLFRSPILEGLGYVFMGSEPQNTFMLPGDSIAGRRHVYVSTEGENAEHWVGQNDGTKMANLLVDWWDKRVIERVLPTTWMTQLLANKETGNLESPQRTLLHAIVQVEEIVRASCGLKIDYSPSIPGGRKHRGIIAGKEVVFNLGTPKKTNPVYGPVYSMTISETYRGLGDFNLLIAHQNGRFDRFFLFPQAFLHETFPRIIVPVSTYNIYPSERFCPRENSRKLQALQERFEIKCDQQSLQILPEYKEKFKKILNGDS